MSKYDRAVAQGLGEQSLDAALYDLRRDHEKYLIRIKGQLKEACTKTEHLRSNIDEQGIADTDISSEIEALLAQAESELNGKAKACEWAAQILEAFRLRHGLTRMPAAPQVAISAMVLSLMGFIETAVNASFFANAHMVAGPFASLLTSGMISLTNISVSALGGFLIGRWMDYGRNAEDASDPEFLIPRLRARIALGVFIAIMILFHMTVGLVRATESLDVVHHGLSSYALVFTTPEALFLVMTGTCLSVLAYRKGKHAFDDPYPGYGPRYRALETLRDEVVDTYEEFREQIEDRFDEAQRAAAKNTKSCSQALTRYNEAVESCHTVARKLEQAVNQAESTMRMQVAQLASHHRAARGRCSAVSSSELEHLLLFEGFLPESIPQIAQDKIAQTHQERFAIQKADALARLSRHFQSLLNVDEEDV